MYIRISFLKLELYISFYKCVCMYICEANVKLPTLSIGHSSDIPKQARTNYLQKLTWSLHIVDVYKIYTDSFGICIYIQSPIYAKLVF